jgi:hypothetical protein
MVEHIVNTSVDKVALIPLTHVTQPSFESDGYWIVKSQHHVNVAYKMKYSFIEYAGCTCEWALQGNVFTHQIVIILMATNVTQKDVIDYCGTWYKSKITKA